LPLAVGCAIQTGSADRPSLRRWRLRMKGILAFPNDADRFVVQGVQMLLKRDRRRAWRPGEARARRLVFMGRVLPKDALRAGLEKCIAVN
jgi:G3E family GTPase